MAYERICLNDFSRVWADVGPLAEEAFSQVGRSGWYVLGREVQAFEEALAAVSSLSYTVGCASGLDAIEIGLRALDLRPGEPVLTTPMSAFATTLAILRAGGHPVFVDIDHDGQIDLELAEQAFRDNPKLKTMVPVHLYGRSLDLSRLASLRDEFGLNIVEDMAQAIGASHGGLPVGSVGQIAATSFYPTKNLGCLGDGGAVLTAQESLAKRCRSLRDYGQSAKYVHDELGLNSRLDEVQAAVLRKAMLPRWKGWTERRKEIACEYGQRIAHPEVVLPTASDESVWHLYAIRTRQRESLMQHLSTLGVQSAVHYPVLITEQEALRGLPASPPTPRAKEFAETVLSLPIHPYLTAEEMQRVIEAVNSWDGEGK